MQQIKQGGLPPARIARKGSFTVSIHKIIEDPDNERQTFRDMDGLTESVARYGILEPPTVTEENGVYKIITGHRRVRAARANQLEEIEVIIREPDDAVTRRRKSIVSNLQREDIGPVELAEGLLTLMNDGVESQRELGALIGKPEAWVSSVLGILRIPAELQEKLRASQLAIPYDSAIKIARCQDPALQRELVEAALKGETSKDIRQRIADSRPGANGERRPSAGKGSGQNGAQLLTFYASCEGYTASVRGPEGEDAKRHMCIALQKLLDQLKYS